jgi:hypothetical protein
MAACNLPGRSHPRCSQGDELFDACTIENQSMQVTSLDIRATAAAASGDFQTAIKSVRQAITLAEQLNQTKRITDLELRKKGYESGKPDLLPDPKRAHEKQ